MSKRLAFLPSYPPPIPEDKEFFVKDLNFYRKLLFSFDQKMVYESLIAIRQITIKMEEEEEEEKEEGGRREGEERRRREDGGGMREEEDGGRRKENEESRKEEEGRKKEEEGRRRREEGRGMREEGGRRVDEGLLSEICQKLREDDFYVQFECLWILTNLVCLSSEFIQPLMEKFGFLDTAAKLLQSPSEKVRSQVKILKTPSYYFNELFTE